MTYYSSYIKTKSEPRMRLLLELMLVHVAYATSQPSLARVAAVLFMRVPYDDRDRIRSDMKRNSHTHHPLFRGWSNRLRICCLFTLRPSGKPESTPLYRSVILRLLSTVSLISSTSAYVPKILLTVFMIISS